MSSKMTGEVFEEWRRKEWPRQKDREESLYDVVDLYDAFAAGVAHGAMMERELTFKDIAATKNNFDDEDALNELEARIRQRGEKRWISEVK